MLAERVEDRVTPGEQLVGIGLVPGVEEDGVTGRVEREMERDGELHRSEVGAEVATVREHGRHDAFAQLGTERRPLGGGERAEVLWPLDSIK